MLPLKFVNELWLMILRSPHIYNIYVPEIIFVEGISQSNNYSIDHNAVATNMQPDGAAGVSFQLVDESASSKTCRGAAHKHTNSGQKSNNCQSNRSQGVIDNAGSSGSTSLPQSYRMSVMRVAALEDTNVASSNKCTLTTIKIELPDSFDSSPFCRVCIL